MASFKDAEKDLLMRTDDNVIVPFAGHPGANVRTAAPGFAYGLQPDATPFIAELAATIHATLDNCQPHARAAAAKASLRGYLCEGQLLATTHRQGDAQSYRRHLLYADPSGQFSILAIVWRPGQHTPIHGHTAWGVVGVYEGKPYCEVFDTQTHDQPAINLDPLMKLRLKAGDLATVQPGIDDVHRIGNDSLSRCITIHIYGRDLLASPRSINIIFSS
jgi:predicted metal-dependent enzyme (double-stranded beta helix superfamily)